jgi:hypothetical protein
MPLSEFRHSWRDADRVALVPTHIRTTVCAALAVEHPQQHEQPETRPVSAGGVPAIRGSGRGSPHRPLPRFPRRIRMWCGSIATRPGGLDPRKAPSPHPQKAVESGDRTRGLLHEPFAHDNIPEPVVVAPIRDQRFEYKLVCAGLCPNFVQFWSSWNPKCDHCQSSTILEAALPRPGKQDLEATSRLLVLV